MSYKKFSAAQDALTKDSPDKLSKAVPAADQAAAEIDETKEEVMGPPAPKP